MARQTPSASQTQALVFRIGTVISSTWENIPLKGKKARDFAGRGVGGGEEKREFKGLVKSVLVKA